jgi:hypothetical protein
MGIKGRTSCAWAGVMAVVLACASPAAGKPRGPLSLPELCLQLSALQAIHELELTPEQLRALKTICAQTGQPVGHRTAKPNPKLREALVALREAILKPGDDPERIPELQAKVDELRDASDNEVDDEITITDAARRRLPEFVKTLTPTQVNNYLASYRDQMPTPIEQMTEALDASRKLSAAAWNKLKTKTADDVAAMVAGLDKDNSARVRDGALKWLDRVKAMGDGELKSKREHLLDEATHLIGELDPFVALRHWAERDLAELLSNPELPSAIELVSNSEN